MVVADHGMVDIALERRVDVDREPELRRGISLLGGEARFRHLYCEPGAVDDVVARWRERLGADALVVTRDSAIEPAGSARSRPLCGPAWATCWSPAWEMWPWCRASASPTRRRSSACTAR